MHELRLMFVLPDGWTGSTQRDRQRGLLQQQSQSGQIPEPLIYICAPVLDDGTVLVAGAALHYWTLVEVVL